MVTARQLPLLDDPGRPPAPRAVGPAPEPEPSVAGGRAPRMGRRRLAQLALLPDVAPGCAPDLPARPAAIPAAPTPAPRAKVVAAAAFRQRVVLASVDPARNRARGYVLTWQPGLWGGGALVRTWGRLGRPGRSLTVVYDDREAAQATIVALLRRRVRHGYRVVAWE